MSLDRLVFVAAFTPTIICLITLLGGWITLFPFGLLGLIGLFIGGIAAFEIGKDRLYRKTDDSEAKKEDG